MNTPLNATASASASGSFIQLLRAVPLALALLGLGLSTAAGQQQAEPQPLEPAPEDTTLDADSDDYVGRPLADELWRDREYGIAMRLPVGVRTVSRTADEYQLRVADDDETFLITVAVKRSRQALAIMDVVARAQTQILGIHRSSELVDQYALDIENTRLGVMIYRLPHSDKDDAFHGQAIVQLDRNTFAFIEANSEWRHVEEVRPTFEAMIRTLELRGLEELEQQREREIQRTEQWRRELKIEELHEALIPQQTFRIVSEDEDIGWMRVEQEQVEQQGKPGIQVTVQSRVMTPQLNVDSRAVFFSSDDDTMELWEVRTTHRPRQTGREQEQTYVETGIRAGSDITITYDEPLDSDRKELKQPAVGYVPLAETWVLPQVLPNDVPATYGFYSYNPNERVVTYRTEQVVPMLNGYELNTRLRPSSPELQAEFDAERRMQRKQLSPKQHLVPATPEEIARRWRGSQR